MNRSSTSTAAEQSGKKEAIVEQAKHAVTHVAEQAKEQVGTQLNQEFDARKDKALETTRNVADAIRGTSEKLKGVGPLGDVAERAASGIEDVAQFFEGKKIGDIVRDVERFARREPALFLGATFALGLIGGRFLKSSSQRSGGRERGPAPAYARDGAGYPDVYSADYLSDEDLDDDVESLRFGTYAPAPSAPKNPGSV